MPSNKIKTSQGKNLELVYIAQKEALKETEDQISEKIK